MSHRHQSDPSEDGGDRENDNPSEFEPELARRSGGDVSTRDNDETEAGTTPDSGATSETEPDGWTRDTGPETGQQPNVEPEPAQVESGSHPLATELASLDLSLSKSGQLGEVPSSSSLTGEYPYAMERENVDDAREQTTFYLMEGTSSSIREIQEIAQKLFRDQVKLVDVREAVCLHGITNVEECLMQLYDWGYRPPQ